MTVKDLPRLKLIKGGDDFYMIERAEHDGREWHKIHLDGGMALQRSARIDPNANVEGTGEQMLAIADGIERSVDVWFKRVAIRVREDLVGFYSPKNSGDVMGVTSLEHARDLARQIREMISTKGASA